MNMVARAIFRKSKKSPSKGHPFLGTGPVGCPIAKANEIRDQEKIAKKMPPHDRQIRYNRKFLLIFSIFPSDNSFNAVLPFVGKQFYTEGIP
jgi:hypothetical protein